MSGGGSSKALIVGAGALLVLPILAVAAASGQQPPSDPTGPVGGLVKNVPSKYVALVEQAGSMCTEITPSIVAAQIDVESSWNPDARSPYAEGIAQFTPATWAKWGKDYNHDGKADVWDPADAIPSEGAYDCEQVKEVKASIATKQIDRGTVLDNALAAYNGGLGLVLSSRGTPTGVAETDAYYPKIERLAATTYAGGGIPPASGPYGRAAVAAAEGWIGLPYVLGGGTVGPPPGPTNGGFDCSGLGAAVVAKATGGRLLLPHYSTSQYTTSMLSTVATFSGSGSPDHALASMQPGDIIIFNIPLDLGYDTHPWNHVGVYVGGGEMIDAPRPGAVVKVDNIETGWPYPWVARRPLSKYTEASSSSAAPQAVSSPAAWDRPRSPKLTDLPPALSIESPTLGRLEGTEL